MQLIPHVNAGPNVCDAIRHGTEEALQDCEIAPCGLFDGLIWIARWNAAAASIACHLHADGCQD